MIDAVPVARAVHVAAAISLRPVLEELKPAFENSNPGARLEFNYGASGQLRAQIEKGAPVDAFLAADSADLDLLEKAGQVVQGSRRTFARGALVVVVPRSMPDALANTFAVKGLSALLHPGFKHVALGTPASVPVGRYARESLLTEKVFDSVRAKFVFADNARQTLAYIERDEADAAIVYASDARKAKGIRVVWTVPEAAHSPILYAGVAVKGTRAEKDVAAFLAFLGGGRAQSAFVSNGFAP